jgi:hypothetical protein
MRTHQEIREVSLALHRAVAAKLRRDPSLINNVWETLTRWREMDPRSAADTYLDEWAELLRAGLEPTLAMLEDDGDHAADLRQCSPFTRVLTQDERAQVLAATGCWRAPAPGR